MRIKIVKSITDNNGISTPFEMIGKEYIVNKETGDGVWVTEGKLEAFVHYEELEILDLDKKFSTIFKHYLRNTSRDKFYSDLKDLGCTHLL